ncbi:MAG TPA: granule-associated protein [Janthinobacterium sp.]|nr:granule-associated protein [Janthinobacterium sp.]
MFISDSATPAVKEHLDAQLAFFNDMSKTLSHSWQQLGNLNMQLLQTLTEESTRASQNLLTARNPVERVSAAATQAQPIADKLRAYQQHFSRLAADTQVELARVSEQHIKETSRTAQTLAQEVKRVGDQTLEKSKRAQEEALKNFSDPFTRQGGEGKGAGRAPLVGQGEAGARQPGVAH